MPIPPAFWEHLGPGSLLLNHPDPESSVQGIILLPEAPLLVAAQPILTLLAAAAGVLKDEQVYLVSITGHLTALYHSQYLRGRMLEEISRGRRKGDKFGLAFLDLDGFKKVNDRYGHLVADRALKHVADVLRECVRVEASFAPRVSRLDITRHTYYSWENGDFGDIGVCLRVINNLMVYILVKIIAKYFLWLLGKPAIAGKENIPRTGPVIVVANHTSLLDGFLLGAFWPRRITFLSAAYLFQLPVVGAFWRAIGAIPVQNEGSELAGMRAALRVLQGGATLGVFPEGRVCQMNKLCPFQTGWAYLALKTGAPVLPVVIKGTRTALPLGAVFPRRSKIFVQIAAPWTPEKCRRPGHETLAAMNMRLVNQMEQMLNENEDSENEEKTTG